MIIDKFILIGKVMIPCHSHPAKFMPSLVEFVLPCGSAILESVTYHFQVEKQIGSSMKVNFMRIPANAWHVVLYSRHNNVISSQME